MMHPYAAIFFDLDGTLLDTAPDLHQACNDVLANHKKPLVELAEFKNWIHGGADLMVTKSFNISTQDPEFKEIKLDFLRAYKKQSTLKTQFYPGLENLLQFLNDNRVPWGIITNKQSELTLPILAHFGLEKKSGCVISGDTLPQCKPDPAPLLYACQLTHCLPEQTIYIGDTEVDIQAAKAAGMMSIAVGYGYHIKENPPLSWKPDYVMDTPENLISFLFDWRKNSDYSKK